MRGLWATPLFLALAWAADTRYEIKGRLEPPGRALVELHGANTPFAAVVMADDKGRFHFSKLAATCYTLIVRVRRRGEMRQTIEVGPGTATAQNRVEVSLKLDDSLFVPSDTRRGLVSVRQLSVPEKARGEYMKAMQSLARGDVGAASSHLERAVEIAPQFSDAWNNMGTIAYQTRSFERAEQCFRQALEQNPDSYPPLVNLGGVLVTLRKLDEALIYNVRAVLRQPADPLANSQLGMVYFADGNLELARRYLNEAKRLDPAHFSQPQLVLAHVYSRMGNRPAAIAELEDFLARHPDDEKVATIRESLTRLRSH